MTANGKWTVHEPWVSVRNPVGSGDAFFAGLIATLSNGIAVKDALMQADELWCE